VPFVLTHGRSHSACASGGGIGAAPCRRPKRSGVTGRPRDIHRPLPTAVQRSLLTLKAADLVRPPAGSSPLPPRHCLSSSEDSALDYRYAGCATPRSPWCIDVAAISRKQKRGGIGCSAAWPAAPTDPDRVMACRANGSCSMGRAWLPGYHGAARCALATPPPVSCSSSFWGAGRCVYQSRNHFLAPVAAAWAQQQTLIQHLEDIWELPDYGIWKCGRAPPLHLFQSHGWVALDRSVRDAERFGLEAPLGRWREFATACMPRSANAGSTRVGKLSHRASAAASSMPAALAADRRLPPAG